MTNFLPLYFLNDSSRPNGNLYSFNPAHFLSLSHTDVRGYITFTKGSLEIEKEEEISSDASSSIVEEEVGKCAFTLREDMISYKYKASQVSFKTISLLLCMCVCVCVFLHHDCSERERKATRLHSSCVKVGGARLPKRWSLSRFSREATGGNQRKICPLLLLFSETSIRPACLCLGKLIFSLPSSSFSTLLFLLFFFFLLSGSI